METTIAVPKIRIPTFDGSTDPLLWLHRCNQCLDAWETPEFLKVRTVSFKMTGPALRWFDEIERTIGIPTWPEFTGAVRQRFASAPTYAPPPTEFNGVSLPASSSPTIAEILATIDSFCASSPAYTAATTTGVAAATSPPSTATTSATPAAPPASPPGPPPAAPSPPAQVAPTLSAPAPSPLRALTVMLLPLPAPATPVAPAAAVDPLVGRDQQPLPVLPVLDPSPPAHRRQSKLSTSARILISRVSSRRGSGCSTCRGVVRAPPRAVCRGFHPPSRWIHLRPPPPIRGCPPRPRPPARRPRSSVVGDPHAVRVCLRPYAAAHASARAFGHPRPSIHLLPPIGGSPAPRAASALASPSPAMAPATQSPPTPAAVSTAASAALSSASAGAPPRCWLWHLTCSLRRPHRHPPQAFSTPGPQTLRRPHQVPRLPSAVNGHGCPYTKRGTSRPHRRASSCMCWPCSAASTTPTSPGPSTARSRPILLTL